jgi:multidrug efflux pump subunit AcrA (membrane-fusion protein)
MVFTVTDFREWINILYEHPEWQKELRRMVLTDELLELPHIVRELAEAQRQTQLRVGELAEAQRQTQLRVDELAEAQRQTQLRVDELAEAQRQTQLRVDELAEAQRRTEQRVDKLGEAVGGLQNAFGATIEEEAAAVTEVVLRRKGYRILQPAYSLAIDGEIDVVLPLEDPAGKRMWAVVEAKARLGRRNVYRWAQRMRSVGWRKRLTEEGIVGPYLVYVYGIRADLSAQEVARQQGIGLIKSDGEILAPRELIEPVEMNSPAAQ